MIFIFINFLIFRKRSLSVLNNDDDRRNSHHHLMLPPSHLTNNNNNNYSSSSNRSRSRSPHPSLHHHNNNNNNHHHSSSSSLLNKNSSSPPSSSSRKRNSPNVKSNISDTSKNSSHPPLLPPPPPIPSLPPTFGTFDPLTLSIIERQRLSAAYASLFAAASQPNNYFPGNLDPSTFRNNGSSNLFPNLDSSAMTNALMQREHFLNSFRQQQEHIERERTAAIISANKTSKSITSINPPKTERTSPKNSIEEPPRINTKVATSPGSHSSASSSSSSSKKFKHVKREKQSSSPSIPSTNENTELASVKEELTIQSTPSISTTT